MMKRFVMRSLNFVIIFCIFCTWYINKHTHIYIYVNIVCLHIGCIDLNDLGLAFLGSSALLHSSRRLDQVPEIAALQLEPSLLPAILGFFTYTVGKARSEEQIKLSRYPYALEP